MRVVLLLLLLLAPLPARAAEADPVPVSVPVSVPVPVGQGAWPLQPRPRVVAGFDPPAVRWGSGHRGVDLAGRPGAPVHAALAGEVAWVGSIAGVPSVSLAHGGLRTTYQPVTAVVAVGDPVARGQVVGRLGRAGSHCFPGTCLHWGLKRGAGADYLDPLLLVGGGPVRLLPLDGRGSSPAPARRLPPGVV